MQLHVLLMLLWFDPFACLSLGLGRFLRPTTKSSIACDEETEVVVIGGGLAGLSCAALLSQAGHKVLVLESHDEIGGCAHGWARLGYSFESGPSLYSGFSQPSSPNPLAAIFKIIGESPVWLTYDRWGTVLPEGRFASKIGPEEFNSVLQKHGGENAVKEWAVLINDLLKPDGTSQAAQAISPLLLREDAGAILTLARNLKGLFLAVKQGQALNEPFSKIVERLSIKDRFVLNWLDLLTFLLQGLPCEGTMSAVVAYMVSDWASPGAVLDFPKGGSSQIVEALVRGIEKTGNRVLAAHHVEEIILSPEGDRAAGVRVRTRNGQTKTISATKAVVSNCDLAMTRKLIPPGKHAALDTYLDKLNAEVPLLESFIHLHAGIDATGLPTSPTAELPAQWAVVNTWEKKTPGSPGAAVEDPRNVVLVSVPSLLDASLAPAGKHVLHAYVPATEKWSDWEKLERGSEEYNLKKKEAADFLWTAVEQYIPGARGRSDVRVEQIGTPKTHARFLRRNRGSYGPRLVAGSGITLPSHKTPLEGLLTCGDFSFPGIGVPAAAASGAVTATSIMSVWSHIKLLQRAGL